MKDLDGKISRRMSTFAEYDFDIAYRPVSNVTNADYLARPTDVGGIVLHVPLGSDFDAVKQYLITGTIEAETSSTRKATKIRSKSYVIYDRNLYRRTSKGLPYVPDEEKRLEILTESHDDIGHWDFTTTYQIGSEQFRRPKMRVDVAHFMKSCDECQKANPAEQNRPHGKLPVSGLFHTWSIDFAGSFSGTDSGGLYVLLAVEPLSNWPVASVINPDLFNSIGVIRFVRDRVCVQYGNPVEINQEEAVQDSISVAGNSVADQVYID